MTGFLSFAVAAFALAAAALVEADVVSTAKTIGKVGKVQIHYDDAVSYGCSSVVMLGVGTAMSADSYEKVSSDIVTGQSTVVIMLDHNPGWFVKTSADRYAKLANEIVSTITDVVPVCTAAPKKGFIIGGHSASGQAAINSIPKLDFEPVAFLGLDPFRISTWKMDIEMPAMYWGFTETTCAVKTKQAAKAAYKVSDHTERVLYQIENPKKKGTHCIFTDKGCPACPVRDEFDWVRAAVGDTVNRFITAVYNKNFGKTQFETGNEQVNLFVNSDRAYF